MKVEGYFVSIGSVARTICMTIYPIHTNSCQNMWHICNMYQEQISNIKYWTETKSCQLTLLKIRS